MQSSKCFHDWAKKNQLNPYRLSKLWDVSPSYIQQLINRGEPTWGSIIKLSDRIVTLQNDLWMKEQELQAKRGKNA